MNRQLQQQRMSLKLLVKRKGAFLNQLHALTQVEDADKDALKACKTVLYSIEKQIEKLECQMQQNAEQHCRELFALLQTIPGISKKSALELIMVSGGFKTSLRPNNLVPLLRFAPASMSRGSLYRDTGE